MSDIAVNHKTASKVGISRAAMLGLFAIFLGPLLLASIWYANVDEWRPGGHVNHGQLIAPARPVEHFSLHAFSGEPLTTDVLHGKWTFLLLAGKDCDLYCQADLFKVRQAHQMLGKESDRVQRIFVLLDPDAREAWAPRLIEHPHMLAVTGSSAELSEALSVFGANHRPGVYLVDPLGNLMMHYDDQSTTKGMVKDLKRLLKVSQIG